MVEPNPALAKVGFVNVCTIIDGMKGDKANDPTSADHDRNMKNGWKNSALWTCYLNPALMWIPTA